jgi:transposase
MSALTSNRFWLGIDLGQETFDASLAPVSSMLPEWRKLPCQSFATHADGLKQFLSWLAEQSPPAAELAGVCLESTGGYSRRFAKQLLALAPELPQVSIINPKRSLDFARSLGLRDKTDRIDAAVLALFGATFQPPQTPALPEEQQQLRELVRLREVLVKERDAFKNRARESDALFARKLVQRLVRQMQRDIRALEEEARKIILKDQALARDYQLLLSIKGIGPLIAWVLLAELGDLRRFTRNQLIAFAGLYPKLHQSGKITWRRPGLAKGGNAIVRKALYNGARSLFNSKDNTLKDYVDRLQERGEKPMYCLVATMRKMLLVARAVVISGKNYDPEYAR